MSQECSLSLILNVWISSACDWPKVLIASRDTPKHFLSQNIKKNMETRSLWRTLLFLAEGELDGQFCEIAVLIEMLTYWPQNTYAQILVF